MATKSTFGNMVLCLGVITLVCGSLLAGAYVLTEEPIAACAATKKQAAIASVLPQFSSMKETAGGDFVAFGKDSLAVGYVVNTSSIGFGGPIDLMVGFRPDGSIYGVSVLGHSETPGLGAKCTENFFISQFKGFNPAVKRLSVKKDGGDVDAITASTITSRAFCAALDSAVEKFKTIVAKEGEKYE